MNKNKAARAGRLRWFDWTIFAVLGAACYVLFQQHDLLHTGGASIGFLNGHFRDFYEYTSSYIGGCAYMPTTYLLFAIWNLPLKLFGLVDVPTMNLALPAYMWMKGLPVLCFLCSGLLMYRCMVLMGFKQGQARLGGFAFITTPIAMFGVFCMGQYDSLTLVFIMLGLYFYLKEKPVPFALFFGVAITCKYFAFLIFLPMLLLREKKVMRIIWQGILAVLPLGLSFATYYGAPGFGSVTNFSAVNYIFTTSLDTGFASLSLVLILWATLCAWAFFTEPKDRVEGYKWMVFFESLVIFLCFGLSMWHPQWLVLATPFLLMGTMMHKRRDVFWLLDLVMMVVFVSLVVNGWPNNLDQALYCLGVLGPLVRSRVNAGLMMWEIVGRLRGSPAFSMLTALFLINALFKHPRYLRERLDDNQPAYLGIARLRFLAGWAIYLVPMLICLYSIFQAPYPAYYYVADANNPDWVVEMKEDTVLEQHFVADLDTLERIDWKADTQETVSETGDMTLRLIDCTDGLVIHEENVALAELSDDTRQLLRFDPVSIVRGREYKLEITISGKQEDAFAGIYYVPVSNMSDQEAAYINGEKQDMCLGVDIFGR